MSRHGHPTARERHDAAALERALHCRDRKAEAAEAAVAELQAREQRVRAAERARVAAEIASGDGIETDFEGCVG